jgi:hypothetical protein
MGGGHLQQDPGRGGGEAINLRVLFTLNCSAKQTHYLGLE